MADAGERQDEVTDRADAAAAPRGAAPEAEVAADGRTVQPAGANDADDPGAERVGEPDAGEAAAEVAGSGATGADAVDSSFAGGDAPGADDPAAIADAGEATVESLAARWREAARERDELAEELARSRDRHLRLAADFDNFRKRSSRLERQAVANARSAAIRPLLDPLDDLLRVTVLEPQNETSVQAIVDGVDLVERKFMSALEGIGVVLVTPSPGDAFDPNTMEAMMRVPAEDDDQDDTVAQLFQRGYALQEGQLVRPARVSVFKR